MITSDRLKQLMEFAAEITFSVNGSDKYKFCHMGKSLNEKTSEDVYWFGLTSDGKNAFDYPTFEEFTSAKVFDGKSLFEIWDDVTFLEINACDPTEMIEIYLSKPVN